MWRIMTVASSTHVDLFQLLADLFSSKADTLVLMQTELSDLHTGTEPPANHLSPPPFAKVRALKIKEEVWRSRVLKEPTAASVCEAAAAMAMISPPFGEQNTSLEQDGEVEEREERVRWQAAASMSNSSAAASRWPEDFSCLKTGVRPLPILLTRCFVSRKHSRLSKAK